MNVKQLAETLGARLLTPDSPDAEIEHVFAGDRISDLLNRATPRSLLVTNLTGSQVIRLAELMDVPAICFLNDAAPSPEAMGELGESQTIFLVSPLGMFETCGRLYPWFAQEVESGA
ncbi:MAG: hypothetical protein JW797_15165 [Bradymonadales bacterium]|nr:hypothetical protein [Bradymonadales bacterium]